MREITFKSNYNNVILKKIQGTSRAHSRTISPCEETSLLEEVVFMLTLRRRILNVGAKKKKVQSKRVKHGRKQSKFTKAEFMGHTWERHRHRKKR